MIEPLETLVRQEGVFEIHIAAPKMPVDEAETLFAEFKRAGLPKHKYFLFVKNVPPSSISYSSGTPPTGHDIEDPGIMATALAHSYDEVKRLVLEAMAILEKRNYRGNFEVERVISDRILDFSDIDIQRDFPGFCAADLAPLYENHFIYKGRLDSLPSHNEIISHVQKKFDVSPHQIVDFSRNPSESNGLLSRVATIYQPTREEVLRFGKLMQTLSVRSLDTRDPGNYITLTEQVCLVGEPK